MPGYRQRGVMLAGVVCQSLRRSCRVDSFAPTRIIADERCASEMAEDLQRYLFATNQPFARTDLQRYMQQHFKEEIAKEKTRLQSYKQITFDQFEDDKKPVETIPTRGQSLNGSSSLGTTSCHRSRPLDSSRQRRTPRSP